MRNETIPKINTYIKDGLEFVEITNNVGMVTTFTSLGGTLYSVEYLGEYMTMQAKNTQDFLRVYNGKVVGRVAGRIPDATLKIGKKTYKLEANEGKNTLHGGFNSLSRRVFSQRVFNTTEHVHVVYTYFSKDGEGGFPGNGLFEAHYIISNNKPKIKLKLLSYVTEKCPVSLTNHAYFCLGEPNLDNTTLKINASKFIEMNNKDLTLVREKEVLSYLDFRNGKKVMKDMANKNIHDGKLNGYDHYFIFDEVDEEIPQVIMENSKFKMTIYTDFDSVVVYTDNYDAHFEACNSEENIHRGIAIEPQLNPLKGVILNRGDEFDHFIRYEFAKK